MSRNLLGILLAAMFVVGGILPVRADDSAYVPSTENLESREWFQDAKFGVFIHWGIYSELAGMGRGGPEWIMDNEMIRTGDYEKLASLFNPTQFSAREWVKLFKHAGARYITITTKHHDGFAMYDSDVSSYDIVDATPFGRDIIRELKKECDRQGLKLFFYYSQLDWHHPDYWPRARTGQGSKFERPLNGDWSKYLEYQNAQIRELLTNYGDIGGFWFDGWWDRKYLPNQGDWNLQSTYDLIHNLQPQALVGNNHHVQPFPGEDFQMFEQDLPGQNTRGFNEAAVGQLPLETAFTINNSWGYRLTDRKFQTPKELVHKIVAAAGRNSNTLLNVGPMSNGLIDPDSADRLRSVGEWMRRHGESIYETRGGPLPPQAWGVTTQNESAVYIHVLAETNGALYVDLTNTPIDDIRNVSTGEQVDFSPAGSGYLIELPDDPQAFDPVLVLKAVRSQPH